MDHINEIYVYENWKSNEPSLIGTLFVGGGKGKQVVSFEYDDEWLNDSSWDKVYAKGVAQNGKI